MDSAEVKTPFKLAMESFPGVIFRNKMEIEEDLKDCKVAVVGILGDDKSGKSSLMNLIRKYFHCDETGFQGWTGDLFKKWMTGEGFCTNKILSRQGNNILDFNDDGGLYTWSQPFISNPGEEDTSDKVAVLFLDLNMTLMTPSMQLLMCLLCSTLIYNTKSTDVSHFCRLIKTIRKSSLQFLSEGELYKCKDLLFKQLTVVFRDHRETVAVKNGEDKSLSYLSKVLNLKENREIADVIKDIGYIRCFLLPNPKQKGPINDKKYLDTDADFCKHLTNLITQTATVQKLVLKYCNGIAMTGKTFFSTFEAICNIVVFPLSQDFNELPAHDVRTDKREDIKELQLVAKPNYIGVHKKATVQANANEKVISKGNLKNEVPEINKKDSALVNATAAHKFQTSVKLKISDRIKFYNNSMTEILSAIFPLSLEILLEEHNQIIENFKRDINSFYNDDIEASADILSQLIPQLEEAYKIYQKTVENEFAYYQHAENTRTHFEKLFIQEYKKGLLSGFFFQFKVENTFEDLMKKAIHEYILKSPDVNKEELLKTIYKLPDTQKCFKKIKNVQLSLRQYLVEMNRELKAYSFCSAAQLKKFHAQSYKKTFQLCQAEKTNKILDLGLYILRDKYGKINAEILRCEEDAFKNIIIPKVDKFYILEMKRLTQKKRTSTQLTAAHEKLKQEFKEVVRKACSFHDANIPLLKTSFQQLDIVLDSGLKTYIKDNQIKIEKVHVKIQAATRDAQVQYNEAMVKKIGNKTFSAFDLTSLHKECLKGVLGLLKGQIRSIDITEDPTRHTQSLNARTQNYFDSFMEENNTRMKNEEEKQEAERVETEKQEAEEKTMQRNPAAEACSSTVTITNGITDAQSNITMNPKIPLQSIEETTQVATSTLNTASVQILHKIEKKIKQNLSDASKQSQNQIVQKIEKGKLQSAKEATMRTNGGSAADSLGKVVKFEQVMLKTPEDRIKYYQSCMTELLASTFPLPAEKLSEKHNNLLTLFLIEDLINEDTASTNVFQNLFLQLSEIYNGYVTRVENELMNCQHVEKVQEIFEKSFIEVFIERLRSFSFLNTKAWKILNDLMERSVNEYAADSPDVSKEDILTIINRLPATHKCVAEIVELQTVLQQYLTEMNTKIEINNFFSAEQLNEFHSAAKAKTVPLLQVEYQIRIAELGIRILKERYDGIASKINHLESLIESKINAILSTVTPSCPHTEIISRFGEIYLTVKSELTGFCETISVIEPGYLSQLMNSRIKQKMSDDIKQFAEHFFIDETTNKILLHVPTDTTPAADENSANSTSSKKSEKHCSSSDLELQIKKRMEYYHETIAELFSSICAPKQETLFAKHNQVFNEVINQISIFCRKENILLTDALKMIIPQLEEAYKLYQERMEKHLKITPYFVLVQNLYEVTFGKLFPKYLRCGLFLTDNVKQVVKVVVEFIIADPFAAQLHPISNKTILEAFYKITYAQKCFRKVEILQKALKHYLMEMNNHFEVHNFFSVEQLQRFHLDATQNVLKTYKTKEIREWLFNDGFLILKTQYDNLNEEIINNELNIFKTTTIPKIKEFYDQEMKILTQKHLTAIEIIEADATIRQECKQIIQKACSFHETNISVLQHLFDELDSDLLSRMHFYIESNNQKILKMQENIKKIVDEAHTKYKESMNKGQEEKTLNYIELMNLHKQSLQKANKHLRQAIGDEFHDDENPLVPIQPVHLLRCNIEQEFVRILQQSYYKNVENEMEINEPTTSRVGNEDESSCGSKSLEMKSINIEDKKPKEIPKVTAEQNFLSKLKMQDQRNIDRILQQSYYKNVETEMEIPEPTTSREGDENEISSGNRSLEMEPINIEVIKPTEKPEVTSEQNFPSNKSKTEETNAEPTPIVAVEFGFKKIKCGLIKEGKFTVIPNKSGEMEFLNHVAFTPKGEVLVGCKYLDRPLNIKNDYNPGQVMVASPNELDILPLIPFQETAILPKKEFLSGLILSKVKSDAESFLNQTVNSVVITVPLSYTSSQRQAMRDAAIIAGFNSVHLINDITAAALAYANHPSRMNHKTTNLNFLIVNATCYNVDAAVFAFSNGTAEIKSCGGNRHGGLRGKLYSPNGNSSKDRQNFSIRQEKAAIRTLLQHCTSNIDVAEYAVIFDGSKRELFREKLCDVGKNAFKPKSSDSILIGAAHFAELLKCNELSAKSAGRDLFPYSLKCIQPHSKSTTLFNRYLPLPLMDTIHTLNFETSSDFVVEVLEIGNNLVTPSKSGLLQVFVKSMCGKKRKGKISIIINSEGILQFKANYMDNEESLDVKWNSLNLSEEDIAIFASLVKSSLATKK